MAPSPKGRRHDRAVFSFSAALPRAGAPSFKHRGDALEPGLLGAVFDDAPLAGAQEVQRHADAGCLEVAEAVALEPLSSRTLSRTVRLQAGA